MQITGDGFFCFILQIDFVSARTSGRCFYCATKMGQINGEKVTFCFVAVHNKRIETFSLPNR